MKKQILSILTLILLCIVLVGCEKKEVADTVDKLTKENIVEPVLTPNITPAPAPRSTTIVLENSVETEKELIDNSNYVIVIDAGHQCRGNYDEEPIGPGSRITKPKVSSGTQGVSTKVPEYQVNLEVSLKLEDILKEQGYTVVMIRTTNDVDISNSERAAVANENNANAFIRIHCNGSENPKTTGILTMCQTKNNPYCSKLYDKSRHLSECILEELCHMTNANNRGIIETDNMSGINWSQVPLTIVEMGFMTNVEEDKMLNTEEYQDKLAQGIAKGINRYFDVADKN